MRGSSLAITSSGKKFAAKSDRGEKSKSQVRATNPIWHSATFLAPPTPIYLRPLLQINQKSQKSNQSKIAFHWVLGSRGAQNRKPMHTGFETPNLQGARLN